MFEIIDVILAPVFLNGENTGVVFNGKNGFYHFVILVDYFYNVLIFISFSELKTMQKKIILSGEQCNDIRINMDNDKNEYIYQMHIRVSQSNLQLEKTDSLPHICFIHINDTICPLPPQMSIEDETDNVGRRLLKPIDCTQFLILDPNEENKITVTWKPDGANYIMAMYLVKKRSANNLLMKLLKPRSQQSVAESKSDIIKRISNPKSDLERVSNRFSLMCPSGKAKIKIPVKSLHCDHLQCFDARTYISTNDESPSWKCPVCNKFCFYDDLRIDFYVLEIIIKVNIVSRRTRREILNDSALKVYFANTNEIAIIMDDNLTKNLINFMNSNKCYGGNNGPVNFHRKYEEKKENLKLIVDELLSHNEGNTNKDEVQLVKTAQPESTVNSVSQFEIQSAEGVSYSSNRGVEIKVDSTTRINDRTSDHKNDGQDCGEVRTTEVTQSESPFN